tara:strand:- start:4060 stop:4752 length:693 start_codon:yes stop_codon:yes gene_type:complete
MKIKILTLPLLSLLPASLPAALIQIDYGAIGSYETTGNWNNVTSSTSQGSHSSSIADLIESDGSSSGFSLQTESVGQIGANTNGENSIASGFPASASRDSFYFEGSNGLIITLGNLNVGQTYDFTFYAARSGSGSRIAEYEVVGGNTTDTTTLNALGNVSNTTSLSGFTADVNGEIVINVSRTTGSFGYLGVLEIESSVIPEPSQSALIMVAAIVIPATLLSRRRNRRNS